MTASALADALIAPAHFTAPDYAKSLGPEVGELAALAGYKPDPEQQLVLDAMFGMDKKGRFVAFEVANICCRQNMKTGLLKQAALGKSFLLERSLVVWSAHEFSTAQEGFRDLLILIESTPTLDRMVKKVHRANGDEAIELKGGQRIKFKARTKAGGRGLTGDDVMLDEAFALQPDHLGALLPTLSTRPDPQVLYASSAGLMNSAVLRAIRDRGRKGTGRLVYAEWCAPDGCEDRVCSHELNTPGCRLDDEEAWQAANPQMGRRISVEYIRAERDALPPLEFARERLGWWDDPAVGLQIMPLWDDRATEEPPPPVVSVGVAADMDQTWLSLGAKCVGDEGPVHLGSTLRYRVDGGGRRKFVAEVRRIQVEHKIPVGIDPKGPASFLIEDLEDAGVELTLIGADDYVQACADLVDGIETADIVHGNYDDLNTAVHAAGWRLLGDRRVFARRSGDISSLEAVAVALRADQLADSPEPFALWG